MSDDEKEQQESSLPSLVADLESGDGATIYKYRDFSNVAEDEIEHQQPSSASPPPTSSRGSMESSIRVQKFPVKLYAILAQKEFQDIITWLPHGRSWKVLKPNLFESLVMPLFFEYSNYHSFNRLVNAWSFRRISSGPDRGSYYHELFLRGKPHLQKYMRRLPKTHKKLPMKKEDEPDFYAMDKAQPLPALEEVPLPSNTMMPQMMPQMRQQQGLGGGLMQAQMGVMPSAGMSFKDTFETREPLMGLPSAGMQFKDTFEGRDSLMGLNQSRQANGFPTPSMTMSGMGAMNGMGAMHGMGGMNGLGGMNNLGGMNGISGMNNMNSMNGINSLRDSQFPGQGMGDFGGAFGGQSSQLDQFQRLRQIQQMQLFESRMGGAQMQNLGNDTLARMQAENAMSRRLNRQPC
jgi:hypothetical protein